MNVHIALPNHKLRHVSDQLIFLKKCCEQSGVNASISARLSIERKLNIVIENFNKQTALQIAHYCELHKTKVIVLMTEHIDFNDEIGFLFHGKKLFDKSQYMHRSDKHSRLTNLIGLKKHILFLLCLGDLPLLSNLEDSLGIPVLRLAYPHIDPQVAEAEAQIVHPQWDAAFSGFMTDYRSSVIKLLSQMMNINQNRQIVSKHLKTKFLQNAKFCINIPQDPDWCWSSPLRVFSSLLVGRPIISYRCDFTDHLASVMRNFNNLSDLSEFCIHSDPSKELRRQLTSYNKIRNDVKNSIDIKSICEQFNYLSS